MNVCLAHKALVCNTSPSTLSPFWMSAKSQACHGTLRQLEQLQRTLKLLMSSGSSFAWTGLAPLESPLPMPTLSYSSLKNASDNSKQRDSIC